MIIKQLRPRTFDVFWEKGWANWARFQQTDTGLKHLSGKTMPPKLFSQFKSQINK